MKYNETSSIRTPYALCTCHDSKWNDTTLYVRGRCLHYTTMCTLVSKSYAQFAITTSTCSNFVLDIGYVVLGLDSFLLNLYDAISDLDAGSIRGESSWCYNMYTWHWWLRNGLFLCGLFSLRYYVLSYQNMNMTLCSMCIVHKWRP